jgi:hypothetical protein
MNEDEIEDGEDTDGNGFIDDIRAGPTLRCGKR